MERNGCVAEKRSGLILMALSNGIPNFTMLEMEDRSHERFKQYVRKFSTADQLRRGTILLGTPSSNLSNK
ncbi:hypothetical protein Pyn_29071 [Prunus yedoensis var. nudiflora]|uniref:Uncharacterized protein n=1 Tax=Prunus yedoensis var. nudiflora TaxID=2094558 RepID=A0A314Z3M1_PRUYE|nr:hypothetical protein Pyn_29071 [Prunus yedoensis var. nudiflora]